MNDLIGRTAVYRLYGEGDTLVYVGISHNPDVRFSQHARKPWRRLVTHREVIWYPSRAKAEAVERQAIVHEQPLFNIEHNGRRGDMWARILEHPSPAFTPRRLFQLARVVAIEPRVLDLAVTAARLDNTWDCGDCEWEQRLRPEVGALVGFGATGADERLRAPWAYEVVTAAVYELLPLALCRLHFIDSFHELREEIA